MRYIIGLLAAVAVRENSRDKNDVVQITNGVIGTLIVSALLESRA